MPRRAVATLLSGQNLDPMPNRQVSFHYTLRNAGGAVLDTSRGGTPLDFVEGGGQIIEGLEAELRTMQPGESRQVVVPPELGYGLREEGMMQKVPRSALPVDDIRVGDRFRTGPDPSDPVVTIISVDEQEVLLDANHPLAGHSLHFEVELVSVRPAS